MKRNTCICCKGYLHKLISFKNMPSSAQNIPNEDELSDDKAVTLNMCQCESCGLVQLDTEPVNYYKDVIRAGGATTTMLKLRHEEYSRLLSKMREKGIDGRNIVEVGSGKGEFIKMWESLPGIENEQNFHIKGIEHKKDLVNTAAANGLDVAEGFAENDFEIPGGKYDAFVQFNFLEHQPDPLNMLRCIYNNLNKGAIGLVTVPSLEYIIKYDGYYELIRDHIAYYDERTLRLLFKKAGFEILEQRTVNQDTLEIIVQKPCNIYESDKFNGNYLNIEALGRNYEIIKKDFASHMLKLKEDGKTISVWGAGHQGFTLAATTDMLGQVKYIIDSAPFKQGRFAPASHIPIVAPEHFYRDPTDEILIVAPGYTDEIAEIIRKKFGDNVKILALKSEKITEYLW